MAEVLEQEENLSNEKVKTSKKSKYDGGVGNPVGTKYRKVAVTTRKLSFADEVTRKAREVVMEAKSNRKRPPVGHYYPQYS